jgi:trehalose 6-phosphate synthase
MAVDIVVVSNRVARITVDEPITGGLAAALLPAVKESGAIWVGASGRTCEPSRKEPFAEIEALGKGALATVELPRAHYRGYYEGFANSVLWPALHSRADLIRTDAQDYGSYRKVNAFMARALTRFCRAETALWVQDYHFLPLGAELRRLGVARPIGFFLHTPFPHRGIFARVPHHRELVEAMLAYDLIGFQTAESQRHFEDYVRHELNLPVAEDRVVSGRGLTRLGAFPIGIDVDAFASRASKASARPEVARLRASVQGAKLVIGVDRLEYTKGLANRFHAFAELYEARPFLRRAVSLLQIAVPSRSEVTAYRELRSELATLVSEINGRFGEPDWTPIRYLNKGFSQAMLAGFYAPRMSALSRPSTME